jgi:hypothetical protein
MTKLGREGFYLFRVREALVGGFKSTKKNRFKNKPSEMRNSEQKFKRTIGLV